MPPVYEKEQVRCERETGLEMRIKKQEKEYHRTDTALALRGPKRLFKGQKPLLGFSDSGHHISDNSRYLLAYTSEKLCFLCLLPRFIERDHTEIVLLRF